MRLKVIKSRRVSVFTKFRELIPWIFLFLLKKKKILRVISVNSIAQKFLLRNNESIKKGEQKKLSYHAENAWEIYGVCNENYTTTSQLSSFIYGERVYSSTHKKGSKYLSIDNSFVRVFSSFYRHVFLHFISHRCILWESLGKVFFFWGSCLLLFLGCQVAKIDKKKFNLLCLEYISLLG